MCLNPRQVARKDVYGSWHIVTVSCGKCWECVRKRQNEMAALVVRESEFRGSLVHVTFSYAPEHLPMYYVHRFYDADSGEFVGSSEPKRISRSTELFSPNYDGMLLFFAENRYLRRVHAPRRKVAREEYRQTYRLAMSAQDAANELSGTRLALVRREDNFRDEYLMRFGRRECRRPLLANSRLSEDGKLVIETEVRPSLCRRDISLYLKRRRVEYEREFGKKLPEFSYNVIGELGPKHGRPHFHMAICGLPPKDCAWLVKDWHENIGDVKCKHVQRYQKGVAGKDGFEAVGKYIGKYLAKGQEFEEENVIRGFVERPRRCCSANFGVGDLDSLRNFHLCYDLFGQYDVESPASYPHDREALVSWVLSRMYLTINTHKYPIPRRIKQLLFHEDSVRFVRKVTPCSCSALSTYVEPNESAAWAAYYENTHLSRRVVKRSSFLSRMVSNRLQENSLSDYSAKLRAFAGKPLEKTTHSERVAFEISLQNAARERSNSIAKAQHQFLQKSCF